MLLRQRHQPIPKQGDWLRQVVAGFFAYHVVPTNGPAIAPSRDRVIVFWHAALRRRSQKDHASRARMKKLADEWLPLPHILHPWPSERFAVKHPRRELDARVGLSGSVRGALSNQRPYRERCSMRPFWVEARLHGCFSNDRSPLRSGPSCCPSLDGPFLSLADRAKRQCGGEQPTWDCQTTQTCWDTRGSR